MQQVVKIAWVIIRVMIGYQLAMPFLLYLLYRVKKKPPVIAEKRATEADYAIIVTAYEQTHSLSAAVNSLLQMNYSNYIIYIVADKCDISQLYFTDARVKILRPENILGSNTRSHFYAIERFVREHERLTIIDSDNIADAGYLTALNRYFDIGYEAVQGLRKSKNTNTLYARLDAARDHYYHFYDGEVLFQIGSSATLAGSGMAFTVDLYKSSLAHFDVEGAGFDKVLQYRILLQKERIAFAQEAIVYDEKTAKTDQLVNQRARWINSWFRYFSKGFLLVKEGIANKNWNQFLFGIVLLRPPLFMFILFSACCMIIDIWQQPVAAALWAFGFVLFIVSFIISLVHAKAARIIYLSLLKAPLFIFYQLQALGKVKNASKHSVATKHADYIDEVQKK